MPTRELPRGILDVPTVMAWLEDREPGLLIGGLRTQAHADQIRSTFDPSTGRPVGRYMVAGVGDVQAAVSVRSVSLELGGKNPMIVLPDVDVARVAHEVVKAMNLRANAGQSCGSTSRLFLHENIHDDFVEALREELEALCLGPAYDADVDMGPVISASHAERTRAFVSAATDSGAHLVTGGTRDARVPEEGFFVAPTLLADVDVHSAVAQREVFGPVMAAFRWNDTDAMLQAVNDVEYGLTASIWTNDVGSALRLADAVDAGYVWVNDSTTHYWGTPFGGWKNSGLGREESREELLSYLQTKSIHIRTNHPVTERA